MLFSSWQQPTSFALRVSFDQSRVYRKQTKEVIILLNEAHATPLNTINHIPESSFLC